MSDNNMHNRVSQLADVHVELPLHQRKLRAQLMVRHSRKQMPQNWFLSTFITPYKETITHMQKKTKATVFTGVFAALALVAVISAVTLTNSSPVSAAEQQINKTDAVVSQLSPAESAALSQRFNDNLNQRLAEAKQAKDLKFISAGEFGKTTGLNPTVKLPGIAIKSYIAFTADDGDKVIIAVRSDDQPVLLLSNTGAGWSVPSSVMPK